MKKNQFMFLVIFVLATTSQYAFSQIKPTISIGTGIISHRGMNGLAVENEIVFPFKSNFSYGLNIGASMSSDKKFESMQIGSYIHQSYYFSNANIYFEPEIYKNLKISVFAGGGIRHSNSTQILVNSNFDVSPSNEFVTGLGFETGISTTYYFDNYNIGIKYKHDFFSEGFDYFGIKFGINLN